MRTLIWDTHTLSQFGFFRRRKHEEIKQRREELQNLNDNGVTPAGTEVDSANLWIESSAFYT